MKLEDPKSNSAPSINFFTLPNLSVPFAILILSRVTDYQILQRTKHEPKYLSAEYIAKKGHLLNERYIHTLRIMYINVVMCSISF